MSEPTTTKAHPAHEHGVPADTDAFQRWHGALEKRHMADLTFQEVRRAVQALSVAYVHKRGSSVEGALDGAGKRAAFALFYAPLHFLTVRSIIRRIGAGASVNKILDLGCGTGTAGAAWALETGKDVPLVGIERHSWAAGEARWTWRTLGLRGTIRCMDLTQAPIGVPGAGIVAAFTINELDPGQRGHIRNKLLAAHRSGASILIVEPVSRRIAPWWNEWADAFNDAGGEIGEWRIGAELPASLRLMDKAAHLDHRELTARSLWLPRG